MQLTVSPGTPDFLGATPLGDDRVNFAVFSRQAKSIDLCLFTDREDAIRETYRLRLPERTGDVWHIEVTGVPPGTPYGYRVNGAWNPKQGRLFNPDKLLLDPYARRIDRVSAFHPSFLSLRADGLRDKVDSAPWASRGLVPRPDTYDWEEDSLLRRPMRDTVIMEMHVKGFTRLHPDLPAETRGTYAGLGHKSVTDYLRGLGITAVQLLPVHHHLDDGFLLERGLVNYWGYNTLGFFAPEKRYAAGEDPVTEFRDMVKALHRAGLEVILDVVYNHTCEAGVDGPTVFFRGFDNLAYYHTVHGHPGNYHDDTGCGNSVRVPQPFTTRLLMDSLRYWVEEMHVDGFRFDLAAQLGRDPKSFDRTCGFFRALQQDPVLGRVKLIAEPWDIGRGGYQLGNFPSNWAELNGKFRDCIRSFWRGDPGVAGKFASRIAGSEEMFAHNGRRPSASVNLVTSHDGFTLRDLVSYNEKHNLANGEKNRDGEAHNISSNHGVEGETVDPEIVAIRLRQARNFLATVICANGTPFLMAGDEAWRSQQGNNNGYCQDNELSWLDWSTGTEAEGMRCFVRKLLAFRRDHPVFRRDRFYSGRTLNGSGLSDVSWLRPDGGTHGVNDWESGKAGAFAMLIHRDLADAEGTNSGFLVFFFNARAEPVTFHFPSGVPCRWERVIDTAEPDGDGARAEAEDPMPVESRSLQVWRESVAAP